MFVFKMHSEDAGIGQGTQWLVHSGHAVQIDVAGGATVSSSVPVVLSSSEAMDAAFYASVEAHPLA